MDFPIPVWSTIFKVFVGLPDPQKRGSRWNFASISSTSRDIGISICRSPSWIFHFRFGRTVFQVCPLNCWTPKTRGSRWNFVSRWYRTEDTLGVFFYPPITTYVCKKRLTTAGLKSTPTNGPRVTALSLPWRSPIQVLTETDRRCLTSMNES